MRLIDSLKANWKHRLIYEDDEHYTLFAVVDDNTAESICKEPTILKDGEFIISALRQEGDNFVILTVSCEEDRWKIRSYVKALAKQFKRVIWVHRDYKKVFIFKEENGKWDLKVWR